SSTVSTPATALAQDQKLSEIVFNQYIRSARVAIGAVEGVFGVFVPPAFVDMQLDAQKAFTVGLNQAVGSQVSSCALGSSAGGFSWTFDSTLGTFNRVSPSFGPVFADRALTTGRRKLNFGANYQSATFDSLEGVDLDSRAIKSYLRFPIRTAPTTV